MNNEISLGASRRPCNCLVCRAWLLVNKLRVLRSVLRTRIVGLLISQNITRKIYRKLTKRVLEDASIRHFEPSIIHSPDGQEVSEFLVDIVAKALPQAARTELKCGKQELHDSAFLNVFPGEHYRFLSSLTSVANCKTVIEIGTFTGLGTLALCEGLPADGNIHTFDIIPWNKLREPSHFSASDFADGRITQHLGDLSQGEFFENHLDLLNKADLIFMDAPKDGEFEYKMLEKLSRIETRKERLLVLDDIRFVNMIDFWRSISSPKIDVTGFAHWSGTGLVDISDGLRYRGR